MGVVPVSGSRADDSDDDVDVEEDDDEAFTFKYDEAGYIDDDDRHELMRKTVLEREEIIAKRLEEREQAFERYVGGAPAPTWMGTASTQRSYAGVTVRNAHASLAGGRSCAKPK